MRKIIDCIINPHTDELWMTFLDYDILSYVSVPLDRHIDVVKECEEILNGKQYDLN